MIFKYIKYANYILQPISLVGFVLVINRIDDIYKNKIDQKINNIVNKDNNK